MRVQFFLKIEQAKQKCTKILKIQCLKTQYLKTQHMKIQSLKAQYLKTQCLKTQVLKLKTQGLTTQYLKWFIKSIGYLIFSLCISSTKSCESWKINWYATLTYLK